VVVKTRHPFNKNNSLDLSKHTLKLTALIVSFFRKICTRYSTPLPPSLGCVFLMFDKI
jgi:hypothetical protein